jgi:hypothetical protein
MGKIPYLPTSLLPTSLLPTPSNRLVHVKFTTQLGKYSVETRRSFFRNLFVLGEDSDCKMHSDSAPGILSPGGLFLAR